MVGTTVDAVKGVCMSERFWVGCWVKAKQLEKKVSGGTFVAENEAQMISRKTVHLSSLDFQTQITLDSFITPSSKKYCK